MIVLDTNVLSELMRAAPDAKVRDWFAANSSAAMATTAISISEIAYGLARLAEGRRRLDLTERFDALIAGTPGLPVLALEDTSARLAGEFRALREGRGLGSTPSDMMIAGIAMAHGAEVATRNTGDFSDLPVRLLDPWSGSAT